MELYEEEVKNVIVDLPFKLNNDVNDIINEVISIEAYGMVDNEFHYFYISFVLGNKIMYARGDYEAMRSILQNKQDQKIKIQLIYEDDELTDVTLPDNALAYTLSDERFNHINIMKHEINNESVINKIIDMPQMPKMTETGVPNQQNVYIPIIEDRKISVHTSDRLQTFIIFGTLILSIFSMGLRTFVKFYFIEHKPIGIHFFVSLIVNFIVFCLFIRLCTVVGNNLSIKNDIVTIRKWYGRRVKKHVSELDKIIFYINRNVIVSAIIYMGKTNMIFDSKDNDFKLMVEYFIKNADNTKIECYVDGSNERIYFNSLDELL